MLCELSKTCPFFNDKMPIKEVVAKLHKKRYCYKDKTKCARYRVSTEIGEKYAPSNLYPNMKIKANELIKNYSKVKG